MDNNSVMCLLMLVIFVLLIVDICKKKKDEVVEGFDEEDDENMEKIAYGVCGGVGCILISFCLLASSQDESYQLFFLGLTIFFTVITLLLGIGDLLYLVTIKNRIAGIIVSVIVILGLIIGGIYILRYLMNKRQTYMLEPP